MASKIPIRGPMRPAIPACLSRPRIALPHCVSNPALVVPFNPPTSAAAPFSTTASSQAAAAERPPLFNWLRNPRMKKRYGNKNAVRARDRKNPAPGDRKAFRKRVVLSNNSALAVEDMPELGPDTMLSFPGSSIPQPPGEGEAPLDAGTGATEQAGGLTTGGRATATNALASPPPPLLPMASGMVSLPGKLVDQLRLLEAFKSTQPWGLFRSPHFLVREETVELASKLRKAEGAESPLRLIIEGGRAVGKSMLLLQAIAYALMNKWIVIHVPEGQDLTNGNTEYLPVPKTHPIQFTQPAYILKLLERIHDANETLLGSMTTTQEFHSELVHVPVGSTLAELVLAAREAETAWPLFSALWRELTTVPGRPPVLFTLDGLAHISKMSQYRDPAFNLVHAHELRLPRLFLSALSPQGYLHGEPVMLRNGGAVIATAGGNNSPKVPSLNLLLRQGLAAARGAKRIPQRDPYEKGHDERVFESLRGVEVMHVGGVNRTEARAVLEYWAASGLLRNAITEAVVAEKWSVGGSGNLGEIERTSLLSMRT